MEGREEREEGKRRKIKERREEVVKREGKRSYSNSSASGVKSDQYLQSFLGARGVLGGQMDPTETMHTHDCVPLSDVT